MFIICLVSKTTFAVAETCFPFVNEKAVRVTHPLSVDRACLFPREKVKREICLWTSSCQVTNCFDRARPSSEYLHTS